MSDCTFCNKKIMDEYKILETENLLIKKALKVFLAGKICLKKIKSLMKLKEISLLIN